MSSQRINAGFSDLPSTIAEVDESHLDSSMETSFKGPDSEDLFMDSWCMQQDEASPATENSSFNMLCVRRRDIRDTPVSKNPSRRVLCDRSLSADQIMCTSRKRRDRECDMETSAGKHQRCSLDNGATPLEKHQSIESPANMGCALPIISTCHTDLSSVSGHTVKDLIDGRYSQTINQYHIVDCRYPYEYEAGHIKGALNLYTGQQLRQHFFECSQNKENQPTQNSVIILHCEFSSKRGPRMCRLMRNIDRELNQGHYPRLFFPNLYILDGGYSAFFANFKEYCDPMAYTPMVHKDYQDDLRKFKVKSKSWPLPVSRVGACKVALRF